MISTEAASYLMRCHVEATSDVPARRERLSLWPFVWIVLALVAIGLAL